VELDDERGMEYVDQDVLDQEDIAQLVAEWVGLEEEA
jgi:hypothetical protein